MTRSPFSELRLNKMEDRRRRNTTESEDVHMFSGADKEEMKSGESLQEAFKKFRKKRQVTIALHV